MSSSDTEDLLDMMSYVCLVLVLDRCARLEIRSPGNLDGKTVSISLKKGGKPQDMKS